eukprot:g8280.t1
MGGSSPAIVLLGNSVCRATDDFTLLSHYNNTVSSSKQAFAMKSGCLHNVTAWDNSQGVTAGAGANFFGADMRLLDNGVALWLRSGALIKCVKLPVVATGAEKRSVQVDDSVIVGCRDHGKDSTCASGSCRLYRGMLLAGMDIRNTTFVNFQCGHVVFSTLKFTPIGGHNPMSFTNVFTTNVRDEYLVHLTNAQQGQESQIASTEYGGDVGGGTDMKSTCGLRAGVGGFNGAKVKCDSFSRALVSDNTGGVLGEKGRSVLSADQKWPPSLPRACGSVNLADRQDCLWWIKDQPGLVTAAVDTARQGVQTKIVDNGASSTCVAQGAWNALQCPGSMNTWANATCIDTANGGAGGGFSDYLRGYSKPGPLSLEAISNGNTPDFLGREELQNKFRAIGINGHRYRADFTGTTPKTLQLRTPWASPTDSITVTIWYSSPMRLELKDRFGAGIRPVARKGDVYPGNTGSWFFDRLLREIHVTVTGSEVLNIITREVVQVSLTVALTVEEFFGDSGDEHQASFVANMASVLMINPERIRITNIVPGNGRRRLADAATSNVNFEVAEEDPCAGVFCGNNTGACIAGKQLRSRR